MRDYRRHYFRRQWQRQHLRLQFACSCFYGSNFKSLQPIVLNSNSNDSVEYLLSFESPCSAFHSGIVISSIAAALLILLLCYPLPRYWFYLCSVLNPPMYRSLALAHGRSRLRSLCEWAGCRSNPSPSTSRHHPEPAPPTAVHVGGRGLVYVLPWSAGHIVCARVFHTLSIQNSVP